LAKNLRILLILTISFAVCLIMESCCGGYSYRWEYIITETLSDNSLTEADSINAADFGIRLNLVNQKFALNTFTPFVDNLYAFDCWPSYTKQDTIVAIRIITINDFNEDFPSDSDVSELFKGSVFHSDCLSLSDLISRINETDMDAIEHIDLFLKQEPANSSYQRFQITLELRDERILSGEVREVWLN